MSIHGKEFELPAMTDHDAMEDIVVEDMEENGSANKGFDDVMEFEELDPDNRVAQEELTPQAVERLRSMEQNTKVGRAIRSLGSILH